MGMEGR
ncbi:hypothetical protein LINGRAHAP2_LOCUS20886 [Linum grandiflorum]